MYMYMHTANFHGKSMLHGARGRGINGKEMGNKLHRMDMDDIWIWYRDFEAKLATTRNTC